MKKYILFSLIFFPVLASAQFPAPDSFQITVNYIHLGETDWCDNHLVQGSDYCNLYSWKAPNTSVTPATLLGYRIYKDNQLFLSTTNTSADSAGRFEASFYVTAIYANPAGESDPSNVVVVDDLPIATNEADGAQSIGIRFDLSQQMLVIDGATNARELRVYNIQGSQVFHTNTVSTYQSFEGFAPGIYLVLVQDVFGGVNRGGVVVGF